MSDYLFKTQTQGDNSTKAATTAYTDLAVANAVLGQNYKEAAKVATTANLVGTYVAGVFTYTATGADVIDGVTLALNDRVLVKNQSDNTQNGIYKVTTAGAIGVLGVLTRATDANTSGQFKTGDLIFITAGTTQTSTTWAYTGADSPTIGSDPITYVQVAGQGSFTGGNGITITGTSIAINTAVTADLSTAQGLTNKTLTTPVLTGLPTGSGVASAATASTLMSRDANGNTFVNNIEVNYTVTATSGGTLTITVASSQLQVFTGSTTHTLQMPDVSTLTTGFPYEILNLSTGAVTVTSSGGNTIIVLAGGTTAQINCAATTGTTNTSWFIKNYWAGSFTSGKKVTFANNLAVSGTDGEALVLTKGLTVTTNAGTIAFGASSLTLTVAAAASVSGTNTGDNAANSSTMFIGTTSVALNRSSAALTLAGITLTTPDIGTPSAGVLTNATGLPAASVVAGTFPTGAFKVPSLNFVNNAVSVSSNAGTVPISSNLNTFTNSSASAMTITMAVTSAVDGQITHVRIYDASGVAKGITWVNTENGVGTWAAVPTTSNGSTTLPLTVEFMFNGQTSKWRCIRAS